jgi:hypothetical protein
MKTLINYLAQVGLVALFLWAVFAGLNWDMDPTHWSKGSFDGARALLAFFAFIRFFWGLLRNEWT